MLFVKPDVVVVADTLTSLDGREHEYQARWHLRTTKAERNSQNGWIYTAEPGGPNVAIIPLLVDRLEVRTVTAQTDPEVLGWYVKRDQKHEPATTVLHTWKADGTTCRITLLLPMGKGETIAIRSVQATGPTEAMVSLTDGRSWRIHIDADPAGAVQFVELDNAGNELRRIVGP